MIRGRRRNQPASLSHIHSLGATAEFGQQFDMLSSRAISQWEKEAAGVGTEGTRENWLPECNPPRTDSQFAEGCVPGPVGGWKWLARTGDHGSCCGRPTRRAAHWRPFAFGSSSGGIALGISARVPCAITQQPLTPQGVLAGVQGPCAQIQPVRPSLVRLLRSFACP